MERSPLDEYTTRHRAREADVHARERVHVRLGNAKVAIFVATLTYWAWTLDGDPQSWLYVAAAAAFVVLSIWHEVALRGMARATAAAAFYRDGIARIEDRWMRDDPSGARFRTADHPYADDLDLFGPRSLFQLLSRCRTPIGEARLAEWLLQPSPVPVIRERQARVRALRPRLDLRERIAVVNAASRRFLHPEPLIAWAETPASLPPLRPLVVAATGLFVATFFNFFYGGSGWWVVGAAAINAALMALLLTRAHAIVHGLSAATASAGVELAANVIREIERERFDEPALSALAARLGGQDRHAASEGMAALARVSDWADSLHNAYVRLGEWPLLMTLHIAYAAEAWRRRHGAALRDWVDAIGEFEALSSLAAYSYEHPADPFAELFEDTEACFEATEMGHPLIPAVESVTNTFALTAPPRVRKSSSPQVLIVSGSNMSGKSTLLRTTGVNAVLALAGAPVRAQRLRLTWMAVGTCLRHTDSLQEHRSGFYTEALRLRRIADLLDGPAPLLFLFDELLSGTNSKDRRTAAEGVIRMMLSRGAIGLVTTHDLSLTEIAAMFPQAVRNVHLQDQVEDGRMVFDYKLRDGVITHSNALQLMRMIGLDV